MTTLARLHPFTSDQLGLVTTPQARTCGVDRQQVRTAITRGDLRRVTRRVLAVVGAPVSPTQRLLAAILDQGGTTAASYETALAMWGLPGFRLEPFELITERNGRTRANDLANVHTSTYLPAHHLTVVDHVPVVLPTRAIFDASSRLPVGRLERTIDNCWARGLTSGRHLHTMFDELRRRGRRRIAVLRPLLDARGPDYAPPESGLEARFHQICRENDLPTFRRQVDTGDYLTWLGRMDFRHEVLPLVAQLNSDLHHASLVDQRADAAQTERLESAGYVVLPIWQFDVWHEPRQVVTDLRRGLRQAEQNARHRPTLSPERMLHAPL